MAIKFLAGGMLLCLLAVSAFADPDPLQAALDKAKAGYKTEIENATKALGEKFDERIKKAAESGNLDTVLRLKAEKKAFEESDTPPKSVLLKTAYGDYQEQVKAARKKLAEVYDITIKEYTKKLDTDSAEQVRAEYLLFQASPARPPAPLAGGTREVEVSISPTMKMRFCWVPAGEAQLGCPKEEQEYLSRTVLAGKRSDWLDKESEDTRGIFSTRGFWLGKYEVMQVEWVAVMGRNPSSLAATGLDPKLRDSVKGVDTARFPVDSVSWDDCQVFLKMVNDYARGKPGRFVLPHEDEWEYACRGGKGNRLAFYWGGSLNGTEANCNGNIPYGEVLKGSDLKRPARVGSYAKDHPHPWGLCDMHGNVWEWCDNLHIKEGADRVIRGGSWSDPARDCRSAFRRGLSTGSRGISLGFRLSLVPLVK